MRQTRRSTIEPPSLPCFPGYGAGHESWYLTAFGKDNDHLTASLLSRCYSGIFILIILVLFFEEAQKNLLSILIFSPHPPAPFARSSLYFTWFARGKAKKRSTCSSSSSFTSSSSSLGLLFSHATARNRNVLRSRRGRQSTTTRRVWERGEVVESQRQWLRQRLRLRQRQRQSHP